MFLQLQLKPNWMIGFVAVIVMLVVGVVIVGSYAVHKTMYVYNNERTNTLFSFPLQ